MSYKLKKQYRLPFYNYASTNLYFVTLCTYNKHQYFGRVRNGIIELSDIGQIVLECLQNRPRKLSYVSLDQFVIMPDHLHAIIHIDNPEAERTKKENTFTVKERSLSEVVRNFKSAVTLLSRKNYPGMCVWQNRFHDRIIRSDQELHAIRKYIEDNPTQWEIAQQQKKIMVMSLCRTERSTDRSYIIIHQQTKDNHDPINPILSLLRTNAAGDPAHQYAVP
jgi:putative transposase